MVVVGSIVMIIARHGQLEQPFLGMESLKVPLNAAYQGSPIMILSFIVYALFAYGGIEAVGGLVDKTENPKFADFVVDTFGKFRNMNFFLRRSTSYNVRGREQTEEEAIEVDKKFKTFLDKWGVSYTEVEKDEAEFVIIAKILEILKNENRS
jgi:hypothetical protein